MLLQAVVHHEKRVAANAKIDAEDKQRQSLSDRLANSYLSTGVNLEFTQVYQFCPILEKIAIQLWAIELRNLELRTAAQSVYGRKITTCSTRYRTT